MAIVWNFSIPTSFCCYRSVVRIAIVSPEIKSGQMKILRPDGLAG